MKTIYQPKKWQNFQTSIFKNNLFSFFLITILFSITGTLTAQTLKAVSATGSASTTSSTFKAITGATVTLDVTGVSKVLIVSTFEAKMESPGSGTDVREGSFRIADKANPSVINSGTIRRSLSNSGSTDYGIGSVVSIFDVSAFSGNRTYEFQHAFNTAARTLETKSTIVAISLTSGTEQLLTDSKRVSIPHVMTNIWEGVKGSETNLIRTTVTGGFYVAASVESLTATFNTESSAEWKLQYKNGVSGTWYDLSPTVARTMSNSSDIGIISLVGTLPDETAPGDYYFRIAHRRTSATSIIETEAANIVAVSLGTGAGIYPVFNTFGTGITTTSSTLSTALINEVTPAVNTDLFVQAQYEMTASAATNSAKYDIFVDRGIFDGIDQRRYLNSSLAFGSGSSIGLAKNLIAKTLYKVTLRHASAGGNTLTTNDISLTGFALTMNSGPLPIELKSFSAECSGNSSVIITWETITETNNDYFTLYKSSDGKTWKEAGRIDGAGNSNKLMEYSFIDKNSNSEDIYYRLKQTDFNGKYELFNITAVKCNNEPNRISIFPNPATNYLNISLPNNTVTEKLLNISIYNLAGMQCYSNELTLSPDENTIKIDLPGDLKEGLYFIKARTGNEELFSGKFNIVR